MNVQLLETESSSMDLQKATTRFRKRQLSHCKEKWKRQQPFRDACTIELFRNRGGMQLQVDDVTLIDSSNCTKL